MAKKLLIIGGVAGGATAAARARRLDEKAEIIFREALDANAANIEALMPVVSRSIKQGYLDYATELLVNALNYQPDNLLLLRRLALIKMVKRDWDAVQEIIAKIESMPKGHLLAMMLQGKMYKVQDDCTKAINVFKEMLNNYPDQTTALQGMAECYSVLQQRPDMMSYLTKLIKQQPQNVTAETYRLQAQLFWEDNNLSAAVETLSQALEIDNKDTAVYLALAEVYRLQNDTEKAIATYVKGRKASPDNYRILLNLASLYEKVGKTHKAVAIYESVLDQQPRMEIAINNLTTLISRIRMPGLNSNLAI